MRRWSSEHLVALVQLACGIGLLGWGLVAWAPSGGATSIVVVAVVTAGFVVWAWRTWRTAERTPGVPAERWAPAARPSTEPTAPEPVEPEPVEPLSSGDERELARVIATLAGEGVFAPRAPEPAELTEAAADAGPPITADVVLAATVEAPWYHPGFRLTDHVANLALHHFHVEQSTESLHDQCADLLRLADGGLAGVTVAVEERGPDSAGTLLIRLRVTSGGVEQVIDYAGGVKALSTVLHVALARRLHERATGRRLAWVWCDAGPWITGLADGGVERLNAALGPAAGEGWEWVDEQEPYSAGEPG